MGDNDYDRKNGAAEPLPGFKPSVPVVFCGLFPSDAAEFDHLKDSLAKLRLNDSNFQFETDASPLWVLGSVADF